MQALLSLLFSESNLQCPLDVGFKGNPNMGAVVLNDPVNTQSLVQLLNNFQTGDRIFIMAYYTSSGHTIEKGHMKWNLHLLTVR